MALLIGLDPGGTPMKGSAHARITGGDGIMEVLRSLVNRAEVVVSQAVGEQIEDRRERLRAQAEEHEQWQVPPEEITSWESEEGNVTFGVPGDSEYAEQAEEAEYGTADAPPTALIRMGVMSQVSDISWALTDRFRNEGL